MSDRTGQVWNDLDEGDYILIIKSESLDEKGYVDPGVYSHHFICLDSNDSETNFISEYSTNRWETNCYMKRIV